jgi:serine/threonine protein phosphatase PrpC
MRSIKRATRSANDQIHTYATRHSEYRGMGTTATIAGVLGDTLYLAQVGDSRAYLVRNGVARQITKDQSLMQKLIEAGELTEEEAAHSDRRNIILQAIGPEAQIKVDLTHQPIRRGDTLVLCSDGLSGQMSAQDIAALVTSGRALRDVCDALIDRANAAGGPDNITVIVAQFEGSGLQPPAQEDQVGHRVFALAETGQTPVAALEVTQPMPAIRTAPPRPRTPRSVEAVEMPSESDEPDEPVGGTTVAITATVSPARRRVGRLVAGALLILLAAAVAWLILRLTGITAPSAPATTVSHGATPAPAPSP